jgi:hypothetical protein
MQTVIFGIAVPAVVFVFSFYITDRLYRHFSRRR